MGAGGGLQMALLCAAQARLSSASAALLDVVLLARGKEDSLCGLPVRVGVVQPGVVRRDFELSDDRAAGAVAVVECILTTSVQTLVGVDVKQGHSGCNTEQPQGPAV